MAMQDGSPNLGALIDEMTAVRDHKRELTSELKDVNERYEALRNQVLEALDEQGMLQGKGRKASATVTETVVPDIEDWDEVQEFIRNSEADYLYERRISSSAWRELLESGEEVPGIKPFIRRDISLRKSS